ncbi:MAG: hypothetical protein E7Z63_04705 [Thermoplasmata archaeon]|nr:hypothetical protein [Thermoplasmata archaeon]
MITEGDKVTAPNENIGGEGPAKPLEIVRGLRGVIHAFYLDEDTLKQMKEEEDKVRAIGGNIAVDNQGFIQALEHEHIIAIIKDPRFRPPPEPTVELHSNDGKILGVEVFPFSADQYMSRQDVIWLSDGFVLFPDVVGKGGERFVMPPVSFPELNPTNGCKDVISCSPAPTCDLLMRTKMGFADDSKLASVLIAFNECPEDPDWKPTPLKPGEHPGRSC